MAISLGIYPIFPTFFPLGHQPTSPSSEVTANISRSSWANLARSWRQPMAGGRLMGFLFRFNGNLMGIQWDLMGFKSDLMGFNGIQV